MPIQEALRNVVVAYEEKADTEGEVHARGHMRFAPALEGPPGRLHGGHHTIVRTFPILERIGAHDPARTFPCQVDVGMQRSLPLEQDVPFEAAYRAMGEEWSLTTRFEGSDRLVAHVRSLPRAPLMDPGELARWSSLYEESKSSTDGFQMFGTSIRLAPKMVFIDADDALRNAPESQIVALVEPGNTFGPAFVATQLDAVGAVARGAIMRHPHFTKHLTLELAVGRIPTSTRLLCLADRTTMVEDESSETARVEIKGQMYGTARVEVALVDAEFTTVFATGRVTVHPVDGSKFEALKKMRELRKDT